MSKKFYIVFHESIKEIQSTKLDIFCTVYEESQLFLDSFALFKLFLVIIVFHCAFSQLKCP